METRAQHRETLTAEPKLWNLPHWKVHTADHHHVSLSGGKVEDECKKKLLSLYKHDVTLRLREQTEVLKEF